MSQPDKKPLEPKHVMAYGVHVLTALGAALGFLALDAAVKSDLVSAFSWLAAALVVDAADGPLARKLKVTESASRYDGAILDLVVDFVTYVFVPAAILLQPQVIAAPYGMIGGLAISVGSALYFADTTMKTEDWWFRGFPAVWNVIAFYLVIFSPPALVAFAILLALTLGMFVPVIFVHPFRVRRLRALTLAMLVLAAMAAGYALFIEHLQAGWASKSVLAATALYFLGLGFLRES